MGNNLTRTITQIIDNFSPETKDEFINQIELIQIQFDQQNKLELYQQYTGENQQESTRKNCLEIVLTLMQKTIDDDFVNCRNKLYLIKKILPLVLKSIEQKTLEKLTSDFIEKYYQFNKLKNMRQLKQPNFSYFKQIHQIILLCLGRPLYKLNQITVRISNDIVIQFLKDIMNGNNDLSEILVFLTLSQETMNQFRECLQIVCQSITFETFYKKLLSKPISSTSIPLFIHFISFDSMDEITLINQIKILQNSMTIQNTQNIQNCIMTVLQGLLSLSQQTNVFQLSTFEYLLQFLSPQYPPALINVICAILYNSSLFMMNLSPSAANQLISSFLYYSQPNQLISTNYDVFKMLGKIIHRLLHNTNIHLVYSLINSLQFIQQMRKLPVKNYQLPEAYKQWDNQSFELHLKESKIDCLISFAEKWLPKLIENSLKKKDEIIMKLTDEITTNQLSIDFNPLLNWSKNIWLKEMSICYKDLYWNKI